MSDLAALEVALGLVFVYLILSFLCSGVNEAVASVFAWRASMLEEGIRNLLDDPKGEGLARKVYEHPLVSALTRPAKAARVDRQGLRRIPAVRRLVAWTRRERYPSYIPSRSFFLALLDGAEAAPEKLETAIKGLGNPRVEEALLALLRDAEGDLGRFRAGVERWFDDAMGRVSGWYRRRVQLFLWIWAVAIAIVLNADTVQIVERLWTDDTVRAAVVAQAEAGATDPEAIPDVGALAVPLGWSFDDDVRGLPDGGLDWLAKIVGLLLTAAALSLGAPFWFDLLGKVARLRSAGAKPPASPPAS